PAMVSIQKVASTWAALALPPAGLWLEARNAVLAVPPPPLMIWLAVETFRKVLLFMLVPWREFWSAPWRTLFGFFTMSWVTPADSKRNWVGIDRSSSGNVCA